MSARTTIDFGIHLGITHAEIAILRGATTDLIKNNQDNERTPCAVFIDKRGQIHVGQRAKNRLEDPNAADDVHVEFMRRMGTDFKYEFRTAGRFMRAEEVSAEVLKSLRADVQQRLGEDARASVITVPAAFEQKQCAATIKAGQLAGFTQCPLLQEPVAAALAYGFQADVTKEYWLVYDFGGGTFDAAIIKAEDGDISVVNHGGDNYLGGSNMDWAIVDQLIIPELTANHNLPDFARSNKKWCTALAVIKRSVEIAKIQLSRSDTAYLENCRFRDAEGEEVEVDFKLTRDALLGVAEPIILRSVEICKRVLQEKNLVPSVIEKVILVGGPTIAPYFREVLHGQLGIQLDHSVDPLTVVARGAAVFAGTIPLAEVYAPEDNFDDLHAPEVVRPLAPQQEIPQRDRKSPPAKHQQESPVERKTRSKKKAGTSAARSHEEPKVAAPPPPLPRTEPEPDSPSPPQSQPAKPSSRNRSWIAIPSVAGLVLLIWYAASTRSDAPSSAQRASNVVRPQTSQPVHQKRPQSAVVQSSAAIKSRTGRIQLSAFAVAADGQRHPIKRNATVELRHARSEFSISTNIGIPCQWSNIPTGEHRLNLTVAGYRPSTNNILTVHMDQTKEIVVSMHPLPVRVQFVFPVTNVVFGVYNDKRRLGDSTTAYNLTPFIPHYLTFKANGWRPKRVKVQVPEPGKSYSCSIDMERIAAGLRVAVNASQGAPPASGVLSVNGKPVRIDLPFEWQALPVTGALTLVLAVDGFTVLDSPQRVVLVDREVTDVVFTVERRTWMSWLLGPSERQKGKE